MNPVAPVTRIIKEDYSRGERISLVKARELRRSGLMFRGLIQFGDHVLQHGSQDLGEQAFPFRTAEYDNFCTYYLLRGDLVGVLDDLENLIVDVRGPDLLKYSLL